MARTKRKQGFTGVYHVTIRGIDHRQFLEDDDDNRRFMNLLQRRKAKDNGAIELLAYCLMGNHVHLLVRLCKDPHNELNTLGSAISAVVGPYAQWYNLKNSRVGPLYDDRFFSVPVDTEQHLSNALIYIHHNPVKANITKTLVYKYSSFADYNGKNTSNLVDKAYVESMIDIEWLLTANVEAAEKAVEELLEKPPRWSDKCAKEIIHGVSGCSTVSEFLDLPIDKQITHIATVSSYCVTVNQLNRLTGLSRRFIRKIYNKQTKHTKSAIQSAIQANAPRTRTCGRQPQPDPAPS